MPYSKLFSLFIGIALFSNVSGQTGINSNWHFGDGIAMDFTDIPPTVSVSNIQTPSSTESATISDEDGNLIAYSDGNFLYNAVGNVVVNGDFSNSATENLLAKVPGDENRYYLFRSDAQFGVDYSIVDISASAGQGEIAQVEKETPIHPHQSQLVIASHPNNVDYWLIIVDNNSGAGGVLNLTSYLVSSAGLINTSTFSENYTFAGWFPTLEEARISPNCGVIATSHKGHYITLFYFDNETGEIVEAFMQSVSLPDSFDTSDLNYLDFSSNSEYVYVLQDNYYVTRFSTSLLNPTDFINSGELVLWNDAMDWSHIKSGPDGNIYLINQVTQNVDYLINTDSSDLDDVTLIEGEIPLEENARFFPNSPSTCLTPQFVLAEDICEGWTSNISATGFGFADSIYWDIDIPGTNDTLFFDLNEEIENLEPGSYLVAFNYLIGMDWYQIIDSIVVYEQPIVDLGPDLVLCEGESTILIAGPPEYNYFWIDGSDENFIEITTPGQYAVKVGNGACVASDEMNATYIYEPDLILNDTVLCNEEDVVVLGAYSPYADSYSWNTGSDADSILVDSEGVYIVSVTNSCFTVIDSSLVEYVIIPEDVVDPFFQVCGDDAVIVNSIYEDGNIQWSNGDFGASAEVYTEGEFSVLINDRDCERIDFFEVERIPYLEIDKLIFPNVFTPDGDGVNDYFRAFDENLDLNPCELGSFDTDLNIFNRWGNLLESTDCRWSGEDYASGVYYFIAEIESQCLDFRQERIVSGYVHLQR